MFDIHKVQCSCACHDQEQEHHTDQPVAQQKIVVFSPIDEILRYSVELAWTCFIQREDHVENTRQELYEAVHGSADDDPH